MEQSNGRVEHSSLTSSALKTFDLPATGRDSARSGGGEGSAALKMRPCRSGVARGWSVLGAAMEFLFLDKEPEPAL